MNAPFILVALISTAENFKHCLWQKFGFGENMQNEILAENSLRCTHEFDCSVGDCNGARIKWDIFRGRSLLLSILSISSSELSHNYLSELYTKVTKFNLH